MVIKITFPSGTETQEEGVYLKTFLTSHFDMCQ